MLRLNSENKFRKRGNKKDRIWKDVRADTFLPRIRVKGDGMHLSDSET